MHAFVSKKQRPSAGKQQGVGSQQIRITCVYVYKYAPTRSFHCSQEEFEQHCLVETSCISATSTRATLRLAPSVEHKHCDPSRPVKRNMSRLACIWFRRATTETSCVVTFKWGATRVKSGQEHCCLRPNGRAELVAGHQARASHSAVVPR